MNPANAPVVDQPAAGLAHSEDASAVLSTLAARSAAQADAENFPVALRVVPARAREHLQRLYAFARFVDDVGDEAPGDRHRLLTMVEADVLALPGGAQLPAVAGLAPLVTERAVPLRPLLDLVAANQLDQDKTSYADYDELIDYCRLSADPIGRVVLYIAGAVTPANLRDSDSVCSALQVLEHCQDVGEDLVRGRVYLPADDLAAAGVSMADLEAGRSDHRTSPELRAVVARQVGRAESGLAAGPALVRRLRGWARIAVAGYIAGGRATADALRAADFDVLGRDVRPGQGRTVYHAARLLVRR